MLPREIVGSFLIGFFASLLVVNALFLWMRKELAFAVFAGICLFSIFITYCFDIRVKETRAKPAKRRYRYCYECGAENHPSAQLCFKCGAKLG